MIPGLLQMAEKDCNNKAVFRIRAMLVRIRIQIFGSRKIDCGSGSSDFQDASKISFLSNLFCLLLSVGPFTYVLTDKKVVRKSLKRRSKGFLNFFCLLMERYGAIDR